MLHLPVRGVWAVALACAFGTASVSAHGFVSQVVVDGIAYAGNIPGSSSPGASPIRMISTIDPVKGATSADINCGWDAQLAEVVAPASAGSEVTFQWAGGSTGGSNWPHNTGPLMTYMASCGNVSCAEFNATEAAWFKIAELGLISSDSGSVTWYQEYIEAGDSYTVTLPANLEAGGYLIRHEIIALQLAMSEGGAEFYPSCTQIEVGGDGTGVPDSDETCTFPGGYADDDPGIYTPDVYDPGFTYDFPGPAISQLVSGDGEGEITSALGGDGVAITAGSSASVSASVLVVPSGTSASAGSGASTASAVTTLSATASTSAPSASASASGGTPWWPAPKCLL
ncbi:lytic polysaccharide monooxygenase [Laetiporus sulphureus 93-53]|uniref:AA9 family lytic polysaccharide monooxygenase n=1 Tax=Laetiporus sulphureus 93-53 TaxID=1314785 RepID=A0A165BET6_9APHY|nr:lytic polysaccharide monooxygenase [Laetiporus sulphureus 93-53]KZT00899.1 lytic polysaccharide monooxygenase [Laetiporus sulphureus 93-53]